MKTKYLFGILASIALLCLWACEKDSILLQSADEVAEFRAKGGEKGKPDKPADDPVADITITDLGDLGGYWSSAHGIALNDLDGKLWIVGKSHHDAQSLTWNAFLWKGDRSSPASGSIENIDPDLGNTSSTAEDVNRDGDIVGSMMYDYVSSYELYAMMWRPDGTVINLGAPLPFGPSCWSKRSEAMSINDNGIAAGRNIADDSFHPHLWSWDPPAWSDLENLGGDGEAGANAEGINNNDVIVGWARQDGSERAVIWDPADPVLRIIPGLENTMAEAMDINDNGVIAVNSHVPFIWDNGSITELPSLGEYTGVEAISENGYVTGYSSVKGPGTNIHAFLWHEGGTDEIMIDLGGLPVDNKKYIYNVGYDVLEDPDNSNIIYVVGESEYRAVLWTVDITPLL